MTSDSLPSALNFDGWALRECELPAGMLGGTDLRHRVIYVDSRMSPAQRRGTIAHEVIHALLRHDGPQPEWVEDAVEVLAAASCFTDEEWLEATTCAPSERDAARELGVDLALVQAYREARSRTLRETGAA